MATWFHKSALVLPLFAFSCTGFSGDADTSSSTLISASSQGTEGDGDGDPSGDGDGNSSGDGDGNPTGDGDGGPSEGDNAVDILFIVDNSGSMGATQARLVATIDELIAPLDAANVDYRIAVTTSDNGNTWCSAGTTTPEGGKFVLSSCTTRLGDFLFNNGAVDVTDVACNDVCFLDPTQLTITPTTTELDGSPSPRPWVERTGGVTNLPPGTDIAEALRCFLPQGINGCGFESQLESMYLGLQRAQSQGEAEYGFLRPDAVLAVIIVSDEADCSNNKTYSEIFEADGNRVFWSDPMQGFPTSAVCWNAGVTCSGDPNNYSSCDPVNKDVNGNEGVADNLAVLYPLGRYLNQLDGLEQQRQQIEAGREIVVALIGGVDSNGEAFYADVTNTDPDFQTSFGIGPSCTSPGPITAIPPVRMRDIADSYDGGQLYSLCASSYAFAMADIANRILTQI